MSTTAAKHTYLSKCVCLYDSCISIDSPCEREHHNPDSLDARLFPSVVLAVAPAVTMDEASSLQVHPLGFTLCDLQGSVVGCKIP